jgi:hypothetical protein
MTVPNHATFRALALEVHNTHYLRTIPNRELRLASCKEADEVRNKWPEVAKQLDEIATHLQEWILSDV